MSKDTAFLIDETNDVSGKEQATVIVRHADGDGIKEDFIGFAHAKDLIGH